MSLTHPTDLRVVRGGTSAIAWQNATIYQTADGRWHASTITSDAIGHTRGALVATSRGVAADDARTTGLRLVTSTRLRVSA